jgi:hypothetical protein
MVRQCRSIASTISDGISLDRITFDHPARIFANTNAYYAN